MRIASLWVAELVGVAASCPNTAPFTSNFYTNGYHLFDEVNAAQVALIAIPMASL